MTDQIRSRQPENVRMILHSTHKTRWVETIAIALFISSFTVYMAYMMILTPKQERMLQYLTHDLNESFKPGISYSCALEKVPAKPGVYVFLTETATASGTASTPEEIIIKDRPGNELILKFSDDVLVSKKFTWMLNNQMAAQKANDTLKQGFEAWK